MSITLNFRIKLQEELSLRCRRNPAYSLRAFARFLEVEPSFLSKLLKGKRSITRQNIHRFGEKLGLTPNEVSRYSGAYERARKESVSDLEFKPLSEDEFRLVSDWYYYAILEVVTVSDFKPDPRWIARTLGTPLPIVQAAVERLFRLGYLEARGRTWVNASGSHTTITNPFTASAFRRLQKQVLRKAVDAMERVPMDRRDQSSLTFRVQSKNIPKAKLAIKRFRRRMMTLMQEGDGSSDEVYQLAVSLYPVTDIRRRPNEGVDP